MAGLTLVFLGVLISTIQSFPGDANKSVLPKYKRAAVQTLAAFVLCMVSAIISFVWLLVPASRCLYWVAVVTFIAALASVLVVAVLVVRQIVWR